MCGFAGYMGNESLMVLEKSFSKIKHRGPDSTKFKDFSTMNSFSKKHSCVLWFHRLSINGLTEKSSQPMNLKNNKALSHLWLVCNGEIYNHKSLALEHGVQTITESDCEIILHLYAKLGMNGLCKSLDGVFAFCLYDSKSNVMYSARDRYGVRPSYYGVSEDGGIVIASEIKAMSHIAKSIQHFPPGSWWSSETIQTFYSYFDGDYSVTTESVSEEDAAIEVRKLLTAAVEKRMMSDREVGCLLSGGLDSSLIAALASKHSNKKLKTFSIGMPGSPDLVYASRVAEWINSDHHTIELSSKDFISSIEEVIYAIESYDTTSVRASVGNYLVGKYINENTDVKVVFNGDGSDEVCMGYLYNQNAPSDKAFFLENLRLLNEIHAFDVLRSDRSVSSHGLEARTPFLDRDFVDYYMQIPVELKKFGNRRPEKHLLRKAFSETGILPGEVLWRTKCAFSDAVSSKDQSWHKMIQAYVDTLITDQEFQKHAGRYAHATPQLKESYYYRKIFETMFGVSSIATVPHLWVPNWTNSVDPSARELSTYQEDEVLKDSEQDN
jgi:asparagine synthase (glutamine-hydrolysing)